MTIHRLGVSVRFYESNFPMIFTDTSISTLLSAAPMEPEFQVAPQWIQESLTCPIHLDLFENPRCLPCGHIYCCGCLQQLLKDNKLKCPLCRTGFVLPSSGCSALPQIFVIDRLIKNISDCNKQANSPERLSCEFCYIPFFVFLCFCEKSERIPWIDKDRALGVAYLYSLPLTSAQNIDFIFHLLAWHVLPFVFKGNPGEWWVMHVRGYKTRWILFTWSPRQPQMKKRQEAQARAEVLRASNIWKWCFEKFSWI